MTRGDFVVVALQGDYGKPRPALVLQSDFFDEHPSVTIGHIEDDAARRVDRSMMLWLGIAA